MMPNPKKVFVKTYGCQMNVYDSERMRETLAPLGYAEAATADDADLVILNTCHIREKAAEKVYSELGRIRRIKQKRRAQGRDMLIAVAGCVAQAEGEEIVRRVPAVDLVFGPQTYHRLPQLLERRAGSGRAVIEAEFPAEDKFDGLGQRKVTVTAVTAFVTVQEGCDKFCTFCVVPYTRGAEFSRPVAQIESEARRLAQAGVREVTLLGQNVNAYHGRDANGAAVPLAGLIARLSQIDGIERLRYMTSHPRDMDDDLIAAHGDNPKLMPYLHLPVQAGSDAVLKAMNRGHTAKSYLRLIERIRKARPDIAISGDFIVGFPGETDGRFRAHPRTGARGRLCRGLFLQIFAAAGNSCGRSGKSGGGTGQACPAASIAGPAAAPAERLQRRLRQPQAPGFAGKTGPRPGPVDGPFTVFAGRASERREINRGPDRRGAY